MACFHREPITAMSEEEPRERKKLELAVALAKGSSISAWARANNVPRQTARRWAHEPEVRTEIEAYRRGVIDRAVGLLAKNASWAAGGICKLAKESDSDSVKLRAFRSILLEMMAVSKYSGLEARLAEIEQHYRAQLPGVSC